MASLDLTMLAIGLAIVWVGIAAYVVRLAMLTSKLRREVRSLRDVVSRRRQDRLGEAE